LRWGLVPSWADDPKIGYRTINARLDTAPTKPVFRSAFKHRHCLVLAYGFYEWRKTGGMDLLSDSANSGPADQEVAAKAAGQDAVG
jgi:putative SOS response-associated peptidase YedK